MLVEIIKCNPQAVILQFFKHPTVVLAYSHKLNKANLMLKGEDSGGRNSYGEGKMKVSGACLILCLPSRKYTKENCNVSGTQYPKLF